MILKMTMNFDNYSESALNQVVDTAIDRPFDNQYGNTIGKIIHAARIPDTTNIEFEVEVI